jgi:ABC-type antimicrobial peptide transport system permease subunit
MGAAAGIGLAIAGGRLIAAQLYGVAQADPLTFAASVTLVLIAALLAMAYPAFRAARVDPMAALRQD